MAAQGKAYQHKCKTEGRGHSNGPPHVWTYGALLEASVEIAHTEAPESEADIVRLRDLFSAMSVEEKAETIKYCKRSDTYRRDKAKITFFLPVQANKQIVHRFLVDVVGAQHVIGRAPPSNMSRELQAWLTNLTAK